jgi:hypothetical protein
LARVLRSFATFLGQNLLRVVVQNAGVGDAAASTITFALVNAAGTVRSLTGTQAVPVLAGGSSAATQTTVTVPSDIPFATDYTLRACADYEEIVAEVDEENNCAMAIGRIRVRPAVPAP